MFVPFVFPKASSARQRNRKALMQQRNRVNGVMLFVRHTPDKNPPMSLHLRC